MAQPCGHAILHYGLAPRFLFGEQQTCPGLSFDITGTALCALAGEQPTPETRKAFGIGNGCDNRSKMVVNGKQIAWDGLSAETKKKCVRIIMKNPELMINKRKV